MQRLNDHDQHEVEDWEARIITELPLLTKHFADLEFCDKREAGMALACHPAFRDAVWSRVSDETRFWAVVFDEPGGVDMASVRALVHQSVQRVLDDELATERGNGA